MRNYDKLYEKENVNPLGLDANVYAMEERPLIITVVIALPYIEEMGELLYSEITPRNELVARDRVRMIYDTPNFLKQFQYGYSIHFIIAKTPLRRFTYMRLPTIDSEK
jgi:hypothetical protein